MKLFALFSNGKQYQEVMAKSRTDLKQILDHDRAVFSSCKISAKEVGIYFSINSSPKLIRYEHLKLNDHKDVRTINNPMAECIALNKFDNDNTTFFMVERGLLNEERTELTEKGAELQSLLVA